MKMLVMIPMLLLLYSARVDAQGRGTVSPQDVIEQVGIDQKLGDRVPLDLAFADSDGQPVMLGDFFGERPLILALVYY